MIGIDVCRVGRVGLKSVYLEESDLPQILAVNFLLKYVTTLPFHLDIQDAGTSSGQPSKRHLKSLKIGVVGGVAVT